MNVNHHQPVFDLFIIQINRMSLESIPIELTQLIFWKFTGRRKQLLFCLSMTCKKYRDLVKVKALDKMTWFYSDSPNDQIKKRQFELAYWLIEEGCPIGEYRIVQLFPQRFGIHQISSFQRPQI